jgi:hypothetical protein
MKGALSGNARRRSPDDAKTTKQQTKKSVGLNGLRSESSNLSEASLVLSGIEASQIKLKRRMSLGSPTRLAIDRRPESTRSLASSGGLAANENSEHPLTVAMVNNSSGVAFSGQDDFMVDFMLTPIELKWESFASRIIKKGNWARFGSFAMTLITLPEDVAVLFDKAERAYNTTLTDSTKLNYFKKFMRATAGHNYLTLEEVPRVP